VKFKKVHVRSEMFTIHCGDGNQKIRWLAEAACHKCDPDYLFELGPIADVKLKEGKLLNLDDVIDHTLQENVHIYVQLSEDIAAEQRISGDKGKKRK
jgi:hypothetical protein